MAQSGHRSVLFFLVSRTNIRRMVPAEQIDPIYAKTLRWASENGLEIMAHCAEISSKGVEVGPSVPVILST